MTYYIYRSLRKINFHLKYFNPVIIQKLCNCNIIDVEKEWKESKKVPEYFNFFQDVIKFWASKEKNSERKGFPAFWHVDENNNQTKWNFQDLVIQTEKTANVLRSCGLQRNDRMVVILPKIPEWWLIELASFQLGIISSPSTVQLRSKDILYRINGIEAKCIVADLETSERVDEIAKECPTLTTKILCTENKVKEGWIDFKTLHQNSSRLKECVKTKISDPLIFFFTSGSTGNPKIVYHTHENAFAACINRRYWLPVRPDSLMWGISDTGWVKTTWNSLFFPWSAGSGIFIQNFSRFDPKTCLQTLQDYPISNLCAPATAFKLMVKEDLEKYKFAYLTYCISSGEPLTKKLYANWFSRTGLKIHEVYGQSETSVLCSNFHCEKKKPGSIGLPPPGLIELLILNENFEEVEPFQEGEIAVKTKPNYPIGLFKEYLNNPKKTEEVFKNGYYLTGDRGFRDEDGYFWFVGRKDDIIKSSGYRIGPYEVESALLEHPAVKECVVVASPDPIRGEVVKAFIILTDAYLQANKEELRKHLQDHTKNVTSPYKYPRKIEFVQDLPRTFTGKVQRFKLREMERQANKNF